VKDAKAVKRMLARLHCRRFQLLGALSGAKAERALVDQIGTVMPCDRGTVPSWVVIEAGLFQ
jgi:hypothetical protein